jgi:hypothetical protein
MVEWENDEVQKYSQKMDRNNKLAALDEHEQKYARFLLTHSKGYPRLVTVHGSGIGLSRI